MRKQFVIIPLLALLSGCLGFGGKKALPDKRTQVPGTTEVTNYLETVTTVDTVHCIDDEDSSNPKPKTFFHDGYAKITTNLVGQDVSHQWDASWNTMIDETLEEKFPELIEEDFRPDEGDLIQLGCPGLSVSSKKDKKRFWALFLASLARVQSGFDPSFQTSGSGLFALKPAQVNPIGGECAGKDKWDFMEPSYSFGCALQVLRKQMGEDKKLLRAEPNENTIFSSLTGSQRYEFIKFFKAHASQQFSFCQNGVDAPEELVTAKVEGEKTSSECTPKSQNRINDGQLDRDQTKGKAATGIDNSSGKKGGEGSGSGLDDSKGNENSDRSKVLSK